MGTVDWKSSVNKSQAIWAGVRSVEHARLGFTAWDCRTNRLVRHRGTEVSTSSHKVHDTGKIPVEFFTSPEGPVFRAHTADLKLLFPGCPCCCCSLTLSWEGKSREWSRGSGFCKDS